MCYSFLYVSRLLVDMESLVHLCHLKQFSAGGTEQPTVFSESTDFSQCSVMDGSRVSDALHRVEEVGPGEEL